MANRLPKIYEKAPANCGLLQDKIKNEARQLFLHKKNSQLLNSNQLQELCILLENSFHDEAEDGHQLINYSEFKRIASLCEPKTRAYFTPTIYAKLQTNRNDGKISIFNFFNYILRKTRLEQTKIDLSYYDIIGQGFLRETDMEKYITDIIPTLNKLKSLEESFYPFYICIVVRKFFFFLDPMRHNRIRILDILESGFLDQLMNFHDDEGNNSGSHNNWFSIENSQRIYNQYIDLDEDHNGMLSKTELAKFNGDSLTSVFIDRLFEERLTFDEEIDFKIFVDLILAMENKHEPQSIAFYFPLLDINAKGYIDSFDLNILFKSLMESFEKNEIESLSFNDIRNEIFDMVKPIDPTRITLKDLILCGQADLVISILTDSNGFWAHENRDMLINDVSEDIEDGEVGEV